MRSVIYLDCFSGASGDMLLGALVDAGLPVDQLRAALGSLGVGHELRVSRVRRAGLTATKVDVIEADAGATAAAAAPATASDFPHDHGGGRHHPHDHDHQGGDHEHRSLAEIVHLIHHSALSPAARDRAVRLFERIGRAEAAIHGESIETIHLHEVGAVDSIIDIVGVVFAMEWFGIDDIVASPLNVGGGTIQMAHGRFPVPAPATASLLAGAPIFGGGPDTELVTPTGALLVTEFARTYGPLPAMRADRIGYGAGSRDFTGRPNVLRVLVGTRVEPVEDVSGQEAVLQIECEIDDMNPQLFEPAGAALQAAGALDVFLTPVQMKKGRPGTLLTVLAPDDRRQAISDILFRETTTIGLRVSRVWRETLDRRWEPVTLPDGPVRIKVAERRGEVLNAAPEFDDCVRIARASGRPVREVQADALRAWRGRAGIE